MAGPVDWAALGWILGVILAALSGAFSIWFLIDRSIKQAVASMKQDMTDQMQDLGTRVSAAAGLASLAEKGVADLRAHVAEHYVTRDALSELVAGNREIRESISAVHQRLDRVLEGVMFKK